MISISYRKCQLVLYVSVMLVIAGNCRLDFLHEIIADHVNDPDYYPACNPKLPNLSVNEEDELNSDNIEKWKRENKLYIMGVSNSDCDECCYTESFLEELRLELRDPKNERDYLNDYRDKDIRILRANLSNRKKMRPIEKSTFSTAPAIFIVKERQYHHYTGPLKV